MALVVRLRERFLRHTAHRDKHATHDTRTTTSTNTKDNRTAQTKHNTETKTNPKNATKNQTKILPPLNPHILPSVLAHHAPSLSHQGWTTITFPPSPSQSPLKQSLSALFAASAAFFSQPPSYKTLHCTTHGSEEGYNSIPGEKEFITLRTTHNCPEELRGPVGRCWALAGELMGGLLGGVEESLGFETGALNGFVGPCGSFGSEKTATMMRLFRYEVGEKSEEDKVVAEAHCDLGLLSFVVGDTPGLEVWHRGSNGFWAVEKSYAEPAGSVLVGRQLERLSNGRYVAGGHRVVGYGGKERARSAFIKEGDGHGPDGKRWRYSVVFVLRAHSPVKVDTDRLTTDVTGHFEVPLKCTAGELFRETRNRHFNVNTGVEEREQQKKDIEEMKIKRQADAGV